MRTMSVSLSPQQAERIEAAVESGAYASNSEVVRDALRLWDERQQRRAVEISRLKQAYEEGMASGDPVEIDPEEFLAQMHREYAATQLFKAG